MDACILGRFFQISKYFYQKGYSRALKGSYINAKSEGTAKSAQGTQGFGLLNQPTSTLLIDVVLSR